VQKAFRYVEPGPHSESRSVSMSRTCLSISVISVTLMNTKTETIGMRLGKRKLE